MPCLRATFNNQEIDRRDLAGPTVIGRAPQCDLGVRDIMLSRRHCRIEPSAGNPNVWVVEDLCSKNGTTINGQPLTEAITLCDGDELRLGRVQLRFSMDCLADMGLTAMHAPPRPADPGESMSGSGTFVGVGLLDEDVSSDNRLIPRPRPEPKAPAAFEREDIYSLLNTLASSSWDSIYAEARQPAQARTAVEDVPTGRPRLRPRSPIDLSLQASAVSDRKPMAALRRLRIRRPKLRSAALFSILFCLLLLRCWVGGDSTLPGPAMAAQTRQIVQPVQTPAAQQPALDPTIAAIQAICAPIPLIL